MASFYFDHDVPRVLGLALQHLGHDSLSTRELGRERSNDAEQLLVAAQTARILVTHNAEDFTLLQQAWRLWSVPIIHASILIIPQQKWSAG